jgi:hypothetical protein
MTNSQLTSPLSARRRRPARNLTVAATGIVIAAALSACGSSYGSASDRSNDQPAGSNTGAGAGALAAEAGTIDSCSLLSEDQLSAIVGSAVAVDGPAVEVARGRSCTYTFKESGNAILDEGTIDIATWHGAEFFSAGTIGAPRAGIGQEAQDDSAHGVVMFRVGDDVVQVHVISPDQKGASVQIARAAAGQVAGAPRLS